MKLIALPLCVLASHSAALGQSSSMFPQNAAVTNSTNLSYKIYFSVKSETSSSYSGDSSAFSVTESVEATVAKTSGRPFVVNDSTATRGGATSATAVITNFFPEDLFPGDEGADGALQSKFKDLTSAKLRLDVAPKELTEEEKNRIILNASFNSQISTTLSIHAESESPNFVSSFQDQLLNKKFLTR